MMPVRSEYSIKSCPAYFLAESAEQTTRRCARRHEFFNIGPPTSSQRPIDHQGIAASKFVKYCVIFPPIAVIATKLATVMMPINSDTR